MKRISFFNQLLDDYDYFIFDVDGVLFHFYTPLGDSIMILHLLSKLNKQCYFYSNNSMRGNKELADRFNNTGYVPNPSSVISTPYLTSLYFQIERPEIKNVFAVAGPCLNKELKSSGFNVFTNPHEIIGTDNKMIHIDAVVSGCDLEFSYNKLKCCSDLIMKGAEFIVMDYDPYFALENIKCPASAFGHYPIQIMTKVKPKVICKPGPFALELIMRRDKIPKDKINRILMIGDNLETDISFGINSCIDTLLVFSGVTKEKQLEKNPIKPKYIMDILKLQS